MIYIVKTTMYRLLQYFFFELFFCELKFPLETFLPRWVSIARPPMKLNLVLAVAMGTLRIQNGTTTTFKQMCINYTQN